MREFQLKFFWKLLRLAPMWALVRGKTMETNSISPKELFSVPEVLPLSSATGMPAQKQAMSPFDKSWKFSFFWAISKSSTWAFPDKWIEIFSTTNVNVGLNKDPIREVSEQVSRNPLLRFCLFLLWCRHNVLTFDATGTRIYEMAILAWSCRDDECTKNESFKFWFFATPQQLTTCRS